MKRLLQVLLVTWGIVVSVMVVMLARAHVEIRDQLRHATVEAASRNEFIHGMFVLEATAILQLQEQVDMLVAQEEVKKKTGTPLLQPKTKGNSL